MNYLTNYYKNLSEQLQAKVNHLERLIETFEYSDEERDMVPEARHDQLIDTFAREHTAFFPHLDTRTHQGIVPDSEGSMKHIKSILSKMPGVFTTGEEVVQAANGAGLVFNHRTDAPVSGSLRGGEPTPEQQDDYLQELAAHIDAVSRGQKGSHYIYSRTDREGSEHLYTP